MVLRPPGFEPHSWKGSSGRLPGGGKEAAPTGFPDRERTAWLREATPRMGLGFCVCSEDRHSVTAQSRVTGTLPGASAQRLLRHHPHRSSSDSDCGACGSGRAWGRRG